VILLVLTTEVIELILVTKYLLPTESFVESKTYDTHAF